MLVPLEEILKSSCFKDAKILAGQNRLKVKVGSVTVGEVPDIADWLTGQELVLTTLYAVSKDVEKQVKFASRIINSSASALVVKANRFVRKIPTKIVRLAEERGFPLIEVPVWVRWTAIVKEVANLMASAEAELKLKGGFIEAIKKGTNCEEIIQRAAYLDSDLSSGCFVLVAELSGKDKLPKQFVEYFFETGQQIIKAEYGDSLIVPEPRGFTGFIVPRSGNQLLADSRLIYKLVNKLVINSSGILKNKRLAFGLSQFCANPERFGQAYREARKALLVGEKISENVTLGLFDRLGVDRLLLRLHELDPGELAEFYQYTIAPLVRYDQIHKTSLLTTLKTFLDENGNITATAEKVYAHRHTVRYRLKRIADLTGFDFEQLDGLISLSLGLKIKHLLQK
jgi:sugar diacid utilization regulator